MRCLWLEKGRIELQTEAQEIEEPDDDEDNEPRRDLTDDYLPHVLIMSSGDISPFDLRFVRFADRSELLVTMDLAGQLTIGEDDGSVR